MRILIALILLSALAFADENKYTFDEINPVYLETNVTDLIEIKSLSDIQTKRDQLIDFIWGNNGFPKNLPAEIQSDYKDDRYAHLYKMNLARIDKLVINMDYGMQSLAYFFIPQSAKKEIVIYHQGHRGDFINGIETIEALVGDGYAVLAFSMPLLGMNPKPVVVLPRFGRLKLEQHDHLKMLPQPIKYFVEPMAVALNYALAQDYKKAHMIGISGGGWTTTLYAAIDDRIRYSFPVAGTYPIYLRSDSDRDWGDYEQTVPELYRIANYPELYIMGAVGNERKQFQLLNKFDACCFAGPKWELYYKPVQEIVNKVGNGAFELFSDDSHREHKISSVAMQIVLKQLANQ